MDSKIAKTPVAKKIADTLKANGHIRIDNYFWFNQRENSEVIDYLNQENEYKESVMSPAKKLRERLFVEMKSRLKEDDESVPYKKGNYWYYSRYEKGGEYRLYCRKKENLDAPEEIFLNGNEMSKGKSFFQIGGWQISDDENTVAYGVDTVGRRNYTLHFKKIDTNQILEDKIENTEGGSYAWAKDNKTVFYMIRDEQTLLSSKVYRHKLGSSVAENQVVYEEKNNEYYLGLWRTNSGKYIVSASFQGGVSTEYRLLDATNPNGKFKVFQRRKKGFEYFVQHADNKFYILTNKDGATNFKLMVVNEGSESDFGKWETIVEHDPNVYISDFKSFKDFIAIEERSNALDMIKIINLTSKQHHHIEFSEAVYTAYLSDNYQFDTNQVRLVYSSMTTPWSTYDYDTVNKKMSLLKEQEIPGGYDKSKYQTERLWAKARDGAKIPISIVYKKGFKKNGNGNLLQYGYGSYGYTISPYFSTSRLSLLDRGFAFAITHVRGSQAMGRKWYEDGRKLKKKNTFYDFIDCSKFLIEEKWTSSEHLFIEGGSAGGLLMGAVVNMSPKFYKGVIASVPFVDVVTTMLDDTIPLTTGEFEEWGNPKNKEYYDYMLSYSPYDNVKVQNYPNMLVMSGLHDSQVQYFEPTKWVAKLREMKTDNNVLLLNTNMTSGHGGSSGRYAQLKDTALEYAFVLNLAGIGE